MTAEMLLFYPAFLRFRIGLATPLSSIVQLILCVECMVWLKKRKKV
ncbi:MAG: hypothetical protein PUF59_06600 [Lachnospiraceae bacterium]|nr:hypothetical protein [Cuneatibacter sp.]MDD6456238.1 hypothetical protein [Lachnospiraceae bacterium]